MAKETISQTEGLCKEVANCIRNAYDRGYKQGFKDGQAHQLASDDVFRESCEKSAYEKGLNDGWECVKKLAYEKTEGGFDFKELKEIFDGSILTVDILQNYSASEAVKRVKAWEEKQKADSSKVTRQSIIKSQLMDIVNGQKNPVTADEIAEVLKQLKEAQDETD